MKRLRKWLHYVVPLLLLFGAVAVRATSPLIVEEAHLKVFDAYQRLEPRTYEPLPVAIIDVDDASLEKIGQWPWPRTYLAELLARAFNMGAAVVAFDVVFAEPDRTSPTNVLPEWPATPEIEALRAKAAQLPDHDAIFADIIGQTNVVTGFILTREAGGRKPMVKSIVAALGDNPRLFLTRYDGAVVNLPEIEKAAAGNGSFSISYDRDNIIRRIELLYVYDDQIYPSLAAETLRVVQGASTYFVKSSGALQEESFGEQTGINRIKIGRFEVPTDARGRMWLHFTGHQPRRYVPAWRLLTGDVEASRIEGHILVVGASASGLMDLRATPVDAVIPGVEIHVEAIEQILLGHFLQRPDWIEGAELLYLVVLGLVLIVLLPRADPVWSATLAVGGIVLTIGGSWYLFSAQLFLFDPVVPSLTALLIYLTGRTLGKRRA